MSRRLARLNEQLKRELTELIRTQVRDPRVGLVTITGVEVAGDLGSAKVYVREVGTAEERRETLDGLQAAAPFLRSALGKLLHVRRIPELRFREDRSYESARRIEEVLSDVLPVEPSSVDDERELEGGSRIEVDADAGTVRGGESGTPGRDADEAS